MSSMSWLVGPSVRARAFVCIAAQLLLVAAGAVSAADGGDASDASSASDTSDAPQDPATSTSAPRLVKVMLENAPAAAEARCSYTRTRIDGDEVRRERYHAGQYPRWELESIDGREPTEAERRHYQRGNDDRERRHPLAFDLRGMVDEQHWQRISENATETVFQFRLRPTEDLDERLVEKVVGTLVVDKQRQQPVRITIENTEPAYVAPLVRVAEYLQEMRFRWNEAVGVAVLTQTETRLRGRALGLKPLRKHKLVRYSDYQCNAEVADTP